MYKSEIIEEIASAFHDEWREKRLYKSMIEKSEDEDWTKKHWTKLVDIANTKFEDLPNNWKLENLQAAQVVVDLVYEKVESWEEITPEMIEEMSKIVHQKRLERNWEEWSFENQRVDYEDLSEEEKAKDRVQIQIAIKIISEEL